MSEPTLSIVIEWDNTRLAEIDRASLMADELTRQLFALGEQAEVLFMFDSQHDSHSLTVEKVIGGSGLAGSTADVQLIRIPGGDTSI